MMVGIKCNQVPSAYNHLVRREPRPLNVMMAGIKCNLVPSACNHLVWREPRPLDVMMVGEVGRRKQRLEDVGGRRRLLHAPCLELRGHPPPRQLAERGADLGADLLGAPVREVSARSVARSGEEIGRRSGGDRGEIRRRSLTCSALSPPRSASGSTSATMGFWSHIARSSSRVQPTEEK